MRVLVACEFSGIVRDAFVANGHDAWSCDLLPTERPGNHIQDDVLRHLKDGWELMIAHPPCTFLTAAANRWLFESCRTSTPEQRWAEREKAIEFFMALKCAVIPRKAIENPLPHPYVISKVGRFQQKIQPWEFGEPKTKATCLWLANLPPLMATIIEQVRKPFSYYQSPSSNRSKIRSRTYDGIAKAMANQWGSLE